MRRTTPRRSGGSGRKARATDLRATLAARQCSDQRRGAAPRRRRSGASFAPRASLPRRRVCVCVALMSWMPLRACVALRSLSYSAGPFLHQVSLAPTHPPRLSIPLVASSQISNVRQSAEGPHAAHYAGEDARRPRLVDHRPLRLSPHPPGAPSISMPSAVPLNRLLLYRPLLLPSLASLSLRPASDGSASLCLPSRVSSRAPSKRFRSSAASPCVGLPPHRRTLLLLRPPSPAHSSLPLAEFYIASSSCVARSNTPRRPSGGASRSAFCLQKRRYASPPPRTRRRPSPTLT